MVNILGLEVLQNRHDHSLVGHNRQVGHTPVGTVAARDGYLVALLYTQQTEQGVQTHNLSRQIAEGVLLLLAIVRQRRLVPVTGDSVTQI